MDCVEEAVYKRVRISLPADTSEPAMEEPSVLEHFPDRGITPIVRHFLGEDLNLEVIVAALEHPGTGEDLVDIDAHHVLSRFFKCILESLFVLVGLAFAVGD